jgi:hypothetical protein
MAGPTSVTVGQFLHYAMFPFSYLYNDMIMIMVIVMMVFTYLTPCYTLSWKAIIILHFTRE